MRTRHAIILTVSVLAGCANITSIGRTTHLGMTGDLKEPGAGKAVHLDAQQRIAFINNVGRICAEPSPDALSAVAGSIGGSAGVPGTGSGALSSALSQGVGQAGIRTQSITLMRDALYRMCEAYANGGLSEAQVMSFLSRSQDLTAVVLAVEQLTGPVVGNQVQIGTSASATATATATSATDAIKAQTAYIERQNELLARQRLERSDVEGEISDIDQRSTQIATERSAANARLASDDQQVKDAAAAEIARLDTEKQTLAAERARRVIERDAIDEIIADTERSIANAETRLAELQTKEDQAISDASARSSASGTFTDPDSGRTITDASIVATSVENIVRAALNKSYVVEGCMAILTSQDTKVAERAARLEGTARAEYLAQQEDIRTKCLVIVDNALAREKEFVGKTLKIDRSANATCIRAWWDADQNGAKGLDWLRDNKSLATSRDEIIANPALQRKFINDNEIDCDAKES